MTIWAEQLAAFKKLLGAKALPALASGSGGEVLELTGGALDFASGSDGGGYASETITSGASPVAASPGINVTVITTGGTGGNETITLALPDSPETKVGFCKTVLVTAATAEGDQAVLDTTNIIDPAGNTLSNIPLLIDGSLSLELLNSGGDYKWVMVSQIVAGVLWTYTQTLGLPVDNAVSERDVIINIPDGSDNGGGLGIITGVGIAGHGGLLNLTTSRGSVNGGDIQFITGSGGSGRIGLILMTTLPTSDPSVAGALWNNSGILSVSVGGL